MYQLKPHFVQLNSQTTGGVEGGVNGGIDGGDGGTDGGEGDGFATHDVHCEFELREVPLHV